MPFGVPKTVPLVNHAFVPCQNEGFWRKWRRWRIYVLASKTRALLLRPVQTMKVTKMAGVTQPRAWFTKGMAFVPWLVWYSWLTIPWHPATDIGCCHYVSVKLADALRCPQQAMGIVQTLGTTRSQFVHKMALKVNSGASSVHLRHTFPPVSKRVRLDVSKTFTKFTQYHFRVWGSYRRVHQDYTHS